MTYVKKILPALLVLALLLSLTGCGGRAESPWYMDRDRHWHLNDKGKAVQQKAHTLSGDQCSVCGASFFTQANGELQVQTVNDQGDVTVQLLYDADGALTEDTRTEYTYDEAGQCIAKTAYRFGVLWQETIYATYTHRQETVTYAACVTTCNEDGTRLVERSDQRGPVRQTLYDGDTVVYDYTLIREYDQHDRLHVLRKMERGQTLSETVYSYADDGQLKGQQVFSHGRMVQEVKYQEVDGVWTPSQSVTYRADGTSATIDYEKFQNIMDVITG